MGNTEMTRNFNPSFFKPSSIISTCSFLQWAYERRNPNNNCYNYPEKYAETNGDYRDLGDCSPKSAPISGAWTRRRQGAANPEPWVGEAVQTQGSLPEGHHPVFTAVPGGLTRGLACDLTLPLRAPCRSSTVSLMGRVCHCGSRPQVQLVIYSNN